MVKIGNKVYIGGQAGISGHLKNSNNVQIGGGSGVIKIVIILKLRDILLKILEIF